MRDTRTFLAFLDGQPEARAARIGVTGYCMGGRFALVAAGTFGDRIAAAAAFHPGGLVTDAPDSAHPNLHQAMYEIPDASRPAGTVAQVVQPGYMIGERVLRPALEAVAKAGPKPAASEPPANDNAGPPCAIRRARTYQPLERSASASTRRIGRVPAYWTAALPHCSDRAMLAPRPVPARARLVTSSLAGQSRVASRGHDV